MRVSKDCNEGGKRIREVIEKGVQRDTDCGCLLAQPFLDERTIENQEAL